MHSPKSLGMSVKERERKWMVPVRALLDALELRRSAFVSLVDETVSLWWDST